MPHEKAAHGGIILSPKVRVSSSERHCTRQIQQVIISPKTIWHRRKGEVGTLHMVTKEKTFLMHRDFLWFIMLTKAEDADLIVKYQEERDVQSGPKPIW